MTALTIALTISLALVSTALVAEYRPREWSWRHKPARFAIVAHALLLLVLLTGFWWGEDPEMWLFPAVGWVVGSTAGFIVGHRRYRRGSRSASVAE